MVVVICANSVNGAAVKPNDAALSPASTTHSQKSPSSNLPDKPTKEIAITYIIAGSPNTGCRATLRTSGELKSFKETFNEFFNGRVKTVRVGS